MDALDRLDSLDHSERENFHVSSFSNKSKFVHVENKRKLPYNDFQIKLIIIVRRFMWQVFLMYALFGSIFSVGKIGIASAQPYFLTGTRMLLAGIILLGYSKFQNSISFKFSKSDWILFLLIAFFNVFITNAFEFWGLQYMTAGKTCLIYSLSPFAAALIAYFFKTETMSLKKWMGLIIGFVAFMPMMIEPWLKEDFSQESYLELLAEGALTISAITAVIGWTFVKKMTVDNKMPHPIVNGVSFLLAGGMCLLTSFTVETWNPLPVSSWFDYLWTLVYIVIIHNIICYSIYAEALNRYSVTFMAFAGLSNPLFAALFGWVFLNEPIQGPFWLAFAGVIVGLYLFNQSEQRFQRKFGPGHTHQANYKFNAETQRWREISSPQNL